MHAKWVCKDFEIKHLGKYEPYPTHFLSDPELALQAALKKTKVKSDILTDMLLMIINGWKRY